MPRDHGVGGSGGDAGEGDRLLVVGGGVEGLLEHRQHRRDCGDGERHRISRKKRAAIFGELRQKYFFFQMD